MPSDFKILPLAPEPVPGSSLIDQVENAVNELGTQYDLLENNVVQKADQALEMAQNAEATATDALQTAQEAESKADMAQGAADRASALAKQADDSANETLDRAGSAYDMAALALTDSKEASANSQVALERAETALTRSTAATETADQAILIAQNAFKTANEANGTYDVDDTIYEADTAFYSAEKKFLTNPDSTGLPAGIGFPVYMEVLLNSDLTSVVQRCWSEGSPSVSIRYGSVDQSDPEDMTVAWSGWTKSGGDGSVSGSLKDSVLGAVTINNVNTDINKAVGVNGYAYINNPDIPNLPVAKVGLAQSISNTSKSLTFHQFISEDNELFYRHSTSQFSVGAATNFYSITATNGIKSISDRLVAKATTSGEISLWSQIGSNFSVSESVNSGTIISSPINFYTSDLDFINNGFTITIAQEPRGVDSIVLTVPAGGGYFTATSDTATATDSFIRFQSGGTINSGGSQAEIFVTMIWSNYTGTESWTQWNSPNGGAVLGEMKFFPFRPDEMPAGYYLMNGDQYELTSEVGIVLNSFSDNFKTDWGITITDDQISLPNFFYTDGRGYFVRANSGASGLGVSVFENDAIRNIIGSSADILNTYFGGVRGSGCLQQSSGGGTAYGQYPSVNSVSLALNVGSYQGLPTAAENRTINVGMLPAIYLGV